MPSPTPDAPLLAALAASQRLGMLGATPLADIIDHSESFVTALQAVSGTVVDLGAGGGVPGLVIAWRRPDLRIVLVDRRATRTDHLHRLVARLGLGERASVVTAEARELPGVLGQQVEAVVARGFGKPRTVVAAARPILCAGGVLVVSEPPDTADRWTPDIVGAEFARLPSDVRVAVLRRVPRGSCRIQRSP